MNKKECELNEENDTCNNLLSFVTMSLGMLGNNYTLTQLRRQTREGGID